VDLQAATVATAGRVNEVVGVSKDAAEEVA
jgi:hypothetical protein